VSAVYCFCWKGPLVSLTYVYDGYFGVKWLFNVGVIFCSLLPWSSFSNKYDTFTTVISKCNYIICVKHFHQWNWLRSAIFHVASSCPVFSVLHFNVSHFHVLCFQAIPAVASVNQTGLLLPPTRLCVLWIRPDVRRVFLVARLGAY